MDYCMICGKELDFELTFCCSGSDCGCMGMPIEPPICSDKCYMKLPINNPKGFEEYYEENKYRMKTRSELLIEFKLKK